MLQRRIQLLKVLEHLNPPIHPTMRRQRLRATHTRTENPQQRPHRLNGYILLSQLDTRSSNKFYLRCQKPQLVLQVNQPF